MKIQFSRYFLITTLILGAHTSLYGTQIRTTIKALEDLQDKLINLQTVSDQMKLSLNEMSGLITRLQNSSGPGVITRPLRTAPVRDRDIDNKYMVLSIDLEFWFQGATQNLPSFVRNLQKHSHYTYSNYLNTLEGIINEINTNLTNVLPHLTRDEIKNIRHLINYCRKEIITLAAAQELEAHAAYPGWLLPKTGDTYYTGLPEGTVQSYRNLITKINTFFTSNNPSTATSIYEEVKTTISDGRSFAKWRSSLPDLATLHNFISFVIEQDALTTRSSETATTILADVLPNIYYRTQGLFLGYSLLANNYNEPSFVRWATGEVLWTIGQKEPNYDYEPLSRFITYQLVNLVNSSSSSAVDEAILASTADYKQEKETNRRSKPFPGSIYLSSSDEDKGIGFKVKNLDEVENKKLHYLEAKFTAKGRQVAAWLRMLIFAKTCLENLDRRSFELDLEEARQRQYEIDLAKKNDGEEEKGQETETPNPTPVVDEKTMILIGTVLQKKPASSYTDLLAAITKAAKTNPTDNNPCYLTSISSSPSFETIADYTLNLKYGSLSEEVKAQTLSQAKILVEKVLGNTQSLDKLLQQPNLLDACLRLILATNGNIGLIPADYKPTCYTYGANQQSNALRDYFIITTPKTFPEITESVCKLVQSTTQMGTKKGVIDRALTTFKDLVVRNYFTPEEKVELTTEINRISDNVIINDQHLTDIRAALAR